MYDLFCHIQSRHFTVPLKLDSDFSKVSNLKAHASHLEDVEVNGLMMSLGRNRALPARIPHDDVGIGANGYDTLPRVEVEDLGGIGTGYGDETRRIHDTGVHALLPDDGHAVLDAVHAVRDLGEVVLADGLLVGVEGAVVAARHLQAVPVFVGSRRKTEFSWNFVFVFFNFMVCGKFIGTLYM